NDALLSHHARAFSGMIREFCCVQRCCLLKSARNETIHLRQFQAHVAENELQRSPPSPAQSIAYRSAANPIFPRLHSPVTPSPPKRQMRHVRRCFCRRPRTHTGGTS
ncbi:unnamed protein product, partial [Ascophyllum nodosum]